MSKDLTNLLDKECPYHLVEGARADKTYKINYCHISAQGWSQAHDPAGNPNFIEIKFCLEEDITVNKEVWKNVQITYRPPDNSPRACDGSGLTNRASYWDRGIFHFVEVLPDNYALILDVAMRTDFSKTDYFIKFDAEEIRKGWFTLTDTRP